LIKILLSAAVISNSYEGILVLSSVPGTVMARASGKGFWVLTVAYAG
jgi:hypothetical protein